MEKRFNKKIPKCGINWLRQERHEKLKLENQNFFQQRVLI